MTTPHLISNPTIPLGAPDHTDGAEPKDENRDAVQAWVAVHGATDLFHQFRQLAIEIFPQDATFAFAVEADPDAEEDSVVCVATLPPGHPVKALTYYDKFVAEWARLPDPRLSGLFTLLVR